MWEVFSYGEMPYTKLNDDEVLEGLYEAFRGLFVSIEGLSVDESCCCSLSSSFHTVGLQTGKLKLPIPEGCPSRIYKLMVRCWALSLKERPSFTDIVHALGDLPSDSKV